LHQEDVGGVWNYRKKGVMEYRSIRAQKEDCTEMKVELKCWRHLNDVQHPSATILLQLLRKLRPRAKVQF